MATSESPLWAYVPKPSDPDEVKSLNSEFQNKLIEKVESTDSMDFTFLKALWFSNGSLTESVGSRLTVDFLNGKVELPPIAVSSCQPLPNMNVSSVRYAAFLNISDHDIVSDGNQVVVVSAWENQDKNIQNIYLILDLAEALMLLNAVSRLVGQDKSERTKILYPLLCGKVQVSTCDSKRHSEKGGCCDPEKIMHFTADCESLGFYQNQFSNCPHFDFRFYTEQGPRSIDVIMINKTNGSIQVRQGSNIYVIKKCTGDEESFDKLVRMFKENIIRSQPEKYFSNPEKSSSFTHPAIKPPQSTQLKERSSDKYEYSSEGVWQNASSMQINPEWLNDLHSGKHIPKDEEMLIMWYACEHDLRESIKSGTVPYINPESGGLDPNSFDHLQRSLEDIKDYLFQDDMKVAMSRLRACRSVFGSTLLQPVEDLDEVEFMKRIYFLSGKD